MRTPRAHLGIGQTGSCVVDSATGLCLPGTTTQSPTVTPACQPGPNGTPTQLVDGQCVPALPAGYSSATQSGVIPGNTTGQTGSLPATSQALCVSEGGTWNAATSSCNLNSLCTEFPFGGVYNESSGQCSYMNFYLTLGGIALFAFVLIAISRK